MALEPLKREVRTACLRLQVFDLAYAELVASWVQDAREAYWLAPKTPPPVTADCIRSWRRVGREPLQLVEPGYAQPLGYGELNVLNGRYRHYWLGHLIVPPAQRGCGVGRTLTQLLMQRAFEHYGAQQVSLVVFPENTQAIASYRAAGLHESGYEEHELPAYGTRVRLLRFAMTRRLGV